MLKVYIINLDKDVNRYHHMLTQLAQHGIPEKNIHRIAAVYGKEMEPTLLKSFTKHLTPPQVGCFLSHMKALQEIINIEADADTDFHLVLEDDVVLTEWFPRMTQILSEAPVFDMCWVGNCRAKWPRNACSIIPHPSYDYGSLRRLTEYVYEVDGQSYDNYPMGGYGLVFSKQGAYKALAVAREDQFHNPIDVVYVKTTPEQLKKIMTVPSIITHCYEFDSNIAKGAEVMTNPFENVWKKNPRNELNCLEILQNLEDHLPRNGIQYSLAYGTLLGYARHRTFIPHDDDVDIIMNRTLLPLFQALLPILQQYMNVYTFPHPILRGSLYYKLYPKNLAETTPITGYPYPYPFVDVFVYDTFKTPHVLYRNPCKTFVNMYGKELCMTEETIPVELGSNAAPGLRIRSRVFRDMRVALDAFYPDWQTTCISSEWNHRLEQPNKDIVTALCSQIRNDKIEK